MGYMARLSSKVGKGLKLRSVVEIVQTCFNKGVRTRVAVSQFLCCKSVSAAVSCGWSLLSVSQCCCVLWNFGPYHICYF